MWIQRITVAHWRGLESAELTDLDAGLNLITGPNESGKSRLVQALRFALFESTKGRAAYKQDLQSWGVAPEKPRVEVAFELGGNDWRIEKVFLGTGTNTRLHGGGSTLDGDEAEARLAQLLGVGEPGTKGLKDEDAGIWPLLWVDQGDSRASPTAAANADAKAQLQSILGAEIGEVAAGARGQQLLARARELKERYYTAKNNAEKNPITDARKRVQLADGALAAARAERDAIQSLAEELKACRDADFDERTRETARTLEDVHTRVTQAQDAKQRVALTAQQVKIAEGALEQAQGGQQQQRSLADAIREREARIAALRTQLEADGPKRERARKEHREANEAVAEAERARAAAVTALNELKRRAKADEARAAHAKLSARHDEALRIEAELRRLEDALLKLPKVDADAVKALQTLQSDVSTARAMLQGASASVRIHAERDIGLDGEPLAAGGARAFTVDDDRVIRLDGIARIEVSPGGGELPKLRDAVRDSEAALRARLDALGVPDVGTAEQAAQQRQQLDGDMKAQQAELRHQAPDGRESLARELRELAAQFARESDDAQSGEDAAHSSAGQDPAHGPGDDAATADGHATTPPSGSASTRAASADADPTTGTDEPQPDAATPAALDAAGSAADAAWDALTVARIRRDTANDRLQALQLELGKRETELESEGNELVKQLRQRDALPTADVLAAGVHEAEQQLQTQRALAAQAQQDYDRLGGDRLQLELEQARKAHEQLLEKAKLNQKRIHELQALLQGAGDDGRHERVLDLEAEHAQAEAALQRMLRDAGTARRLFDVLDNASSQAQERLLGPVIARIRPRLADLFPGAELSLDESLQLQGLHGAHGVEGFEFLSGGAREQLALLVRIGLAEVLGIEESWPLVLDDALVNTDAGRIRRVHRLLYDASRRMQILLFTCHAPLYDGLGADRTLALPARERQRS